MNHPDSSPCDDGGIVQVGDATCCIYPSWVTCSALGHPFLGAKSVFPRAGANPRHQKRAIHIAILQPHVVAGAVGRWDYDAVPGRASILIRVDVSFAVSQSADV